MQGMLNLRTSLNHITLIVEVETLTGLVFTTDELIALENLGDFVKLLVSKDLNQARTNGGSFGL